MEDDPKVHKRVCEICGKKIFSLDEKQADHNIEEHKRKHEQSQVPA